MGRKFAADFVENAFGFRALDALYVVLVFQDSAESVGDDFG